jgi:glycosyltransferase involved in cell wall biosynthesis
LRENKEISYLNTNNVHGTMEQRKQSIKISVVVCTYNRSYLLPSCLKSLADQKLDRSLYEVIIVDNNSTDGTPEIANEFTAKYPNFCLVQEKNQGLSHARNLGYHESRGEFVAYIDDDAKADKDWARRIVQAFETVSPHPSAVGGRIFPYYLSERPDWFLDTYEMRTWGDNRGFLQVPRAPYGFSGSNMAFPKKILEKYEGFPKNFGMRGNRMSFGEEAALFYRIYQELPYFWYDPEIKVEHLVPERNMKVGYRLKRIFMIGVSSAKVEGVKPTFFSIAKILISIGICSVSLLLKVRWWRKYWQQDFIHYANPILYPLGRLLGALRIKKYQAYYKAPGSARQ